MPGFARFALGTGGSWPDVAERSAEAWSAVVLSGGRGSRLGGVDKSDLVVRGRTLLKHALDAVSGAAQVIVVGAPKNEPDVQWTRETPPGGGPLAGLAAGVALVEHPRVVVLAVDQPGVTASTVTRLLTTNANAVLVDATGRTQWLTGVWRTEELRAALPQDPRNAPMRAVLAELVETRLPATEAESKDVDTPQDLADQS
ncbi:molybdenum cofactor guanylyltransferase [Actinosynnema pretiosum]|uniref:molybdenum cofactor guanylyltransferase n=1 Tax=Actinosynnema pretiosum TaxID=42197 RepID=UPI0038BD6472